MAGAWDAARQSFADQFEQDGRAFVYRRSQKGEAIRVTTEERQNFIDGFDRNLWRAMFVMVACMVLIIGGMIVVGALKGWDPPEGVIVAGIVAACIPYFVCYRWAWGAPSRALEGRTPIAGARSRDEVRWLTFQKMTYGNLAVAAAGGLVFPFIGSRQGSVFSGWGRLWLAAGAVLILLAGVQAFRKWRFEQDNPDRKPFQAASLPANAEPVEEAASQADVAVSKRVPWRYVPLALVLLGIGFIAYTAVGKRLSQIPLFWPAVIALVGGWALFSVVQGFRKGRITPFVRGSWSSYERETQPKRFWASMAWNGLLGAGLLWASLMPLRDLHSQNAQDDCSNKHEQFTAQDSFDACTQLIQGRVRLTYLSRGDVYDYRGYDDELLNDPKSAVSDYTQAIRLQPKDDYPYLHRGHIFLDAMRFDEAVADFSRAHELDPKSTWALAGRGMAFAWKGDRARAEADFAAVRADDPAYLVVRHGEGVLNMNEGNLEAAVDNFTAALHQGPSDAWSLQMRADAYQQMGEFEKARADRQTLLEMSRSRRSPS